MKSASAGGSGHAHPDQKMSPVRTPRRPKRLGSGAYRLRIWFVQPSTPQRQAAKRKSNAKRRRRDKRVSDE
jgi:hypothetical protein